MIIKSIVWISVVDVLLRSEVAQWAEKKCFSLDTCFGQWVTFFGFTM
jgi:hypothetical protein